jgi:hypothetical protein
MSSGAYERREVAGRVMYARKLLGGRTYSSWEVRKLSILSWPTDDALLKAFGDIGLGGTVKITGKVAKVTVNFD